MTEIAAQMATGETPHEGSKAVETKGYHGG